jgi:dGTPase
MTTSNAERWDRLLNKARPTHPKGGRAELPHRSAFENDADLIVFSPDFRRLQDKTQVYPQPDNDSSHSRMTHSLEVASVARSLGVMCGQELWPQDPDRARSLGQVAYAASLLHDIGNPPFGHAGEKTIAEYFTQTPPQEDLTAVYQDLSGFDGNPQGLRVAVRVISRLDGGPHLTAAVLAGSVKYPWTIGSKPATKKKHGVFRSEREIYAKIASSVGISQALNGKTGEPAWPRHPCAFIVEAADDICNALLDLEDAIRLGYIERNEKKAEPFECLLALAKCSTRYTEQRHNSVRGSSEELAYLRSLAIGEGLAACKEVFLHQETRILSGAFAEPLVEESRCRSAFKQLKEAVHRECFSLDVVVLRELAGGRALRVLLDALVPAAISTIEGGQQTALCRRFLERNLGERWKSTTPAERLRWLLDFIAGMTDRYALVLAKKLSGVSVFRDV